jgi:hypothetical protein
MTLTCDNLVELVKPLPLVQQCDVIKSGALRISTPFRYPNGSKIDVFLQPNDSGHHVLSDGGQTTDYVSDMQFNLWSSKKRRTLIDDICAPLGVTHEDESFEIVLPPDEMSDLSHAIVRLAQACIRATDLIYTQRAPGVGSFQDEIEDFFSIKHISYEPDVVLPGDAGKQVKIDFKVKGERLDSLVQTLSGRTSLHAQANEKLSRWIDLELHKNINQFITVVDQAAGVQPADLKRLEKFSQVFSYPADQEQFYETVSA